jgi:hypothetical protein
VSDQFTADGLLGVGSDEAQFRHAVDHIDHELETVQIIASGHVKGSRGGPLLFIHADVEIVTIRAPACRSGNGWKNDIEFMSLNHVVMVQGYEAESGCGAPSAPAARVLRAQTSGEPWSSG